MSGADMLHCGSGRILCQPRRARDLRFQEVPLPPPLGLSLLSEQLSQELYGHCPRYQPARWLSSTAWPFSSLPMFPKPWLRTTDSIWRVQLQWQTNKRDPNAGRENTGVNGWSGVERALLWVRQTYNQPDSNPIPCVPGKANSSPSPYFPDLKVGTVISTQVQ